MNAVGIGFAGVCHVRHNNISAVLSQAWHVYCASCKSRSSNAGEMEAAILHSRPTNDVMFQRAAYSGMLH